MNKHTPADPLTPAERELIEQALAVLNRVVHGRECISNPTQLRQYLTLRLGPQQREVFSVVFLDAQHWIIACEDMFLGTLAQTSVYPREIARRALQLNAAAVALAHNHPSGCCEPSRADEVVTATVKTALALVDVRVLDHIVVAGGASVSFAERGLL